MTLESQLEADLDWRVAETVALRLQVAAATPGSVEEVAILRALWAMLYAHYEGFCKFALDLYLDELMKAGARREACVDSIASFSLEAEFRKLRRDMSTDACWNFFQSSLPAALMDKLHFEERLETKSNLWPNLLEENCKIANLKLTSIDDNRFKLRTLVSRRNDIAHGKRNIISSLAEYIKYEAAAFEVMYDLALAISEAIAMRTYLKPASEPTEQISLAI
jgi:hypothetical protein